MGGNIGRRGIGYVIDSSLYMFPNKSTTVKVNVLLDVKKSFKVGIHIVNKREGIKWIEFCYARIPMFCFNYGIVGHNEEFCPNNGQKSLNSNAYFY